MGPPESGRPIVLVSRGDTLMIIDRMAYEYDAGLARGGIPSRAELDELLGRVDRIRVLDGGMYRERALGVEVLAEVEGVEALEALREALRVVDGERGHCHCLGGPTLECYAGGRLLATLGLHHGRTLRWHGRWRGDAALADGPRLSACLLGIGVAADPGPSADPLSMGILGIDDADRHAARADSYVRRGDIRRAEEELALARSLGAGRPNLAAIEGLLLAARGDQAAAVVAFGRAIDGGLKDPRVYRARAVALDRMGRPQEALADCDAALAAAPDSPDLRNSRGLILSRLGRMTEAFDDLSRAVAVAPDWVLPRWQRSQVAAAVGRAEVALDDLDHLLALYGGAPDRMADELLPNIPPHAARLTLIYPCPTWCHYFKGEILHQLGRDDEALAELGRAADRDPSNARVTHLRARILGLTDRAEEALDLLADPRRNAGADFPLLMLRAELQATLGRLEESWDTLDEAARLEPEAPQPWLARSQISRMRGRPHQQLADLERAVDLAPDSPVAANSLAWLLATCPDPGLRDGPRALELARRVVEAEKDSPYLAHLLDTLAAALAECGDFVGAVRVQQDVLNRVAEPEKRAEYEERSRRYEARRPHRQGPEG